MNKMGKDDEKASAEDKLATKPAAAPAGTASSGEGKLGSRSPQAAPSVEAAASESKPAQAKSGDVKTGSVDAVAGNAKSIEQKPSDVKPTSPVADKGITAAKPSATAPVPLADEGSTKSAKPEAKPVVTDKVAPSPTPASAVTIPAPTAPKPASVAPVSSAATTPVPPKKATEIKAEAVSAPSVGTKTPTPAATPAEPASVAKPPVSTPAKPTAEAPPKDAGASSKAPDVAPKPPAPTVSPVPAATPASVSDAEKSVATKTSEKASASVTPPPAPAKAETPAAPAAPKPVPPIDPGLIAPDGDIGAVLAANHRDPFGFLGMHVVGPHQHVVVRVFMPDATAVRVIDVKSGKPVATLAKFRDEGFFAGVVEGRYAPFAYRLAAETIMGTIEVDDAYRFPPVLSESDARMLAEGNHLHSYRILGAHPATFEGVSGVTFAVWAPNAGRVAVVGQFNQWDGRLHGMRLRHDCGVWEIFIPGASADALYKFEIKSAGGDRLVDKCDPYAFAVEQSPGSAAVVTDLARFRWQDDAWMERRKGLDPRHSPISIYEVHLGSWRRKPEEGHRCLSYSELAEDLVSYVKDMAFTHVEFLPISEFDVDATLGYQPFAPYAPSSRWGRPNDLHKLIDALHREGIGVILDWVPNHFSGDQHGLRNFDGSHLYEHPDPQRRHHPGTNALNYDYGRREVSNYLLSNAFFWLDEYHVDALRVGALSTMLYLDYGRARGEWSPNRYGGHENLEGVDFLRALNEKVYGEFPGIFTVAEDSSAWARVSHPTFVGGLGFGFKWNQGWVRETLRYISRNPVHRKYYHDELVQGPATAFQENSVIALSHGDVAYGRGSIVHKMQGDRWQKYAHLRLYYAYLFAHPGKKLMFMGDEFAQEREWNADISLDWHMLGDPQNAGIQRLVRDLNALYRSTPALYELDCDVEGFSWVDANDSDQSIISFLRQGKDGKGTIVAICNFTPVVRNNYRVGVPIPGTYRERINTDAHIYGGSNVGNDGAVTTLEESMHGRPYSISLKIPPFSTVIFEHVD